jgi:hypothetical protein
VNTDQERRANAQATGANFIPDGDTPAQPIEPVPEAIAAQDAIDKTLPDLTGEAREAAIRQTTANRRR